MSLQQLWGVDTLPRISPVPQAKWVTIFQAPASLWCFSLDVTHQDPFRQSQWRNGWRRFLTSFRQYKRRNVAGQFWIVVFSPVREAKCIFPKKKVPQSRNFFKKCHKIGIFHNFYHKLVNCPSLIYYYKENGKWDIISTNSHLWRPMLLFIYSYCMHVNLHLFFTYPNSISISISLQWLL